MALAFESAQFIKSAAQLNDCPADVGAEVAFAGRSNAGKSSAINCLTRQTRLARTSKTPGRTQLLNFFSITPTTRLVDLPGYGYAKVPQAMRDAWHRNIDDYLRERMSLVGIVLVMDVRHPMKPFDEMMLESRIQRILCLYPCIHGGKNLTGVALLQSSASKLVFQMVL